MIQNFGGINHLSSITVCYFFPFTFYSGDLLADTAVLYCQVSFTWTVTVKIKYLQISLHIIIVIVYCNHCFSTI